jgi:flagellar biosynthetic protein FliQ
MNIDGFISVGQQALMTAVYIASPILGLGLVAGLSVSIFQAATQINDGALAFIPKILATILGIGLFGNFMLNRLAEFTIKMFGYIADVGH